jgi:hypothetical protein
MSESTAPKRNVHLLAFRGNDGSSLEDDVFAGARKNLASSGCKPLLGILVIWRGLRQFQGLRVARYALTLKAHSCCAGPHA